MRSKQKAPGFNGFNTDSTGVIVLGLTDFIEVTWKNNY